MAGRRASRLAMIVLALILVGPLAAPALAQNGSVSTKLTFIKYNYYKDNNTIIIETPFYKAVINLNRGAGFESFKVKYGNKTYTTSYPGYLAARPWRLLNATNTSTYVKITLAPTKEASVDVTPVNITVTYVFYSYKPLIDYVIHFYNPSNKPIELYSFTINGTKYGPIIELVAGDDKPHLWNYTYSEILANGSVRSVKTNEPSLYVAPMSQSVLSGPYISLVRLKGLKNETVGGYPLYALVASSDHVALVQLLRGYVGDIKSTIRARLFYEALSLRPGEYFKIEVRLAYLPFDAGALALAGFADYYYSLLGDLADTPQVYNLNVTLQRLLDRIKGLNDRINKLQDDVADLRKKLEDARDEADGYKELYSTCKTQLKLVKERLNSCLAKTGRTAAIGIAGLIVGVILGLAGYALVFKEGDLPPLRPLRSRK